VDQAEFFVSPNEGEELRPLARIVSGGELSRIMLAIKTLSATSRHPLRETGGGPAKLLRGTGAPGLMAERGEGVPAKLLRRVGAPGLIFDEVDAGIGGRVADVIGRNLHALSSEFQVLCITHLPQIAAYADSHFQIDKRVDGGRTHASVTRLGEDGRIEELSRMLGGAAITDRVRASAREMLASRQQGEPKPKGESERAKAKPRKPKPGDA
jgi:DNA repair protein RecN (Recombination protein N)